MQTMTIHPEPISLKRLLVLALESFVEGKDHLLSSLAGAISA